ncbi:MAG: N-carbamoyl-D-amino-acid hydrolase [Alphaproteobacteria bacterium]
MPRIVTIGSAQMGPIARDEGRQAVVQRLLTMLRQGADRGCDLVVFPELTLTTFFPRWYMTDPAEVDAWFETEMPNAATQPLFDEARKRGVGFYLGYAEKVTEGGAVHHYNTAILVEKSGDIVGKYRKTHLPGHAEYEPERPFQHLEKRYFEPGNLGFPVFQAFGGVMGMCICNDRRWPETYRVMGMQGVEVIMLGYNTPRFFAPAPGLNRLADFHNHLVMQAGAYQNGTFVIGTAKAGVEEGCELIGESCIIAPTGEIIAQCQTMGDELIVAKCDLDWCADIQKNRWNFAGNREPDYYGAITASKGVVSPFG